MLQLTACWGHGEECHGWWGSRFPLCSKRCIPRHRLLTYVNVSSELVISGAYYVVITMVCVYSPAVFNRMRTGFCRDYWDNRTCTSWNILYNPIRRSFRQALQILTRSAAGFLSRTSSLHTHEAETSTGASREASVGCGCRVGGNRNEIRLSTNKLVLAA
jgi:hypothetical protein